MIGVIRETLRAELNREDLESAFEHGGWVMERTLDRIARNIAQAIVLEADNADMCPVCGGANVEPPPGYGCWRESADPAQAWRDWYAENGKQPACEHCRDTHMMELWDRSVPCTRCPTPCETCRDGTRAYCKSTPCGCSCHPVLR